MSKRVKRVGRGANRKKGVPGGGAIQFENGSRLGWTIITPQSTAKYRGSCVTCGASAAAEAGMSVIRCNAPGRGKTLHYSFVSNLRTTVIDSSSRRTEKPSERNSESGP